MPGTTLSSVGHMVDTQTIGFIGTGEISAAMVTGLAGAAGGPERIMVSPRSAGVSARLAREFPGTVAVAESNAHVVASSDIVVLAILPHQLHEALDGVRFRPEQLVISLLAGVAIADVAAVVGASVPIVRAVPMPAVARRDSVTVMAPPEPRAKALFDLLGGALELPAEPDLAVYSALTGTISGFYRYLDIVCEWAVGRGATKDATEPFVRGLFAALAPALRDPNVDLAHLVKHAETPGGLNEQLRQEFFDGSAPALCQALDGLYERVTRR